jgi:diphthine synthase
MPAFILIGAGLDPKKHLTSEAIAALRSVSMIFSERYTSVLPDDWVNVIESVSGKRIEILDRKAVEEERIILSECSKADVALVVPGDALTATTHIHLVDEAEKRGIKVKVIPGISIMSVAPGLLGLQGYKFGRTVSLPRWREGFTPVSPLHGIIENLSRGLHTLLLLDTEPDAMTASEAASQLVKMAEDEKRSDTISKTTMVCVIARACFDDQKLAYVPLGRLASMDFGPPPHAMVIPGELHFIEKERLDRIIRVA